MRGSTSNIAPQMNPRRASRRQPDRVGVLHVELTPRRLPDVFNNLKENQKPHGELVGRSAGKVKPHGNFDIHQCWQSRPATLVLGSLAGCCFSIGPGLRRCRRAGPRQGPVAEIGTLHAAASRIQGKVWLLPLAAGIRRRSAGEISAGLGAAARADFEILASASRRLAAAGGPAHAEATGIGPARRLYPAPRRGADFARRKGRGRVSPDPERKGTVSRRDRPVLRTVDEHRTGKIRTRNPRLRLATG